MMKRDRIPKLLTLAGLVAIAALLMGQEPSAVPHPPPMVISEADNAKRSVASLQAENVSLKAEIEGLKKQMEFLKNTISGLLLNPVYQSICDSAKIPIEQCVLSQDGKSVERRK